MHIIRDEIHGDIVLLCRPDLTVLRHPILDCHSTLRILFHHPICLVTMMRTAYVGIGFFQGPYLLLVRKQTFGEKFQLRFENLFFRSPNIVGGPRLGLPVLLLSKFADHDNG